MKRLLKFGSLLSFAIMIFSFQSDGNCDTRALKEKAKKSLDPYKYDVAKVTRVVYKDMPSSKEIEVPLFIGEKYRLLFNTEALPRKIVVNLYNRDKDNKRRKLLFSSKDQEGDKSEFTFDYSFATKIFLDYEIPAGDSVVKGGCMVFMMGYK